MTALAELNNLIGKWQGANQLWLFPGDLVRLSHSLAELRAISHNQFSELRYTWAADGQPQEGWIILGQPTNSTQVKAVWLDTWHMAHQFMLLMYNITSDGEEFLAVEVAYSRNHSELQ
jgi:hypothetical protein